MTDLELGTCWMGGTFRRSEFGKTINVLENEVIPGITPLGYYTAKRSFRERTIRWGAKSHSRKTWESLFFDGDFETPLGRDSLGEYAVVLDMVRLAPSASNKQPWQIVKQGQNFHFYLKRTMKNTHGSWGDLQRVDMGIAMCHFDLTARELGMNGLWEDNQPNLKLSENIEYCITWREKPSL